MGLHLRCWRPLGEHPRREALPLCEPFHLSAHRAYGLLDTDDAFWERLHRHYSEPELVELGCFIALTMGQQSWLRLLNIDHHQVLAGTSASMAPGYEDAQRLAATKSSPEYWVKSKAEEAAN